MMATDEEDYGSVVSESLEELREEFSTGKTELMHKSISTN